MPPRSPNRQLRQVATRGRYARTSGNMLVGGPDYAAGVDPGSQPPAIWWMGLDSPSGRPIGPNGPFATSGPAQAVVTRATSLITGPLTAAPFRVQELGFGGKPLGRPRWITDPMLMRPDSRLANDVYPAATKLTRGSFYADLIRSAIHWGVGAFLCQEDLTGQPVAGTMRLIHPGLLSCERAPQDNSLRWVIGDAGRGEQDRVVFDRDGYVTLGPITYRLVALRNPHSPVVEGHSMGVFEMHPSAFQLGSQIDSYASGTFRSGIPAGYLRVDSSMNSMTNEQASELKQRWMSAHGGDRRSIAVLNSFTEFVPLNLSPVDSALAEVKRLSIADTAMAFGLSPETLGVSLSGSATYGNVMAYFEFHRDFGLAPWISAVEDALSALLPGTQGVKVDLDTFANPAPQERFTAYATAIGSGVLTVNECRELEGLEPLPEPEQVPSPAPAPVPPTPTPTPTPDPTPASNDVTARARRPQAWR